MSEHATGPRASSILTWIARAGCIVVAGALCILTGLTMPTAQGQDAPEPQATGGNDSLEQTTIENLRAFAKLYGYVRYFHPSDAAADVDWERLAIYGARQIQGAETPAALKAELERLFTPIAPTIQLYPTGETPPSPRELLTPADTAGLRLVAWQHRGVGLGNPGPYRSIRLNRETEVFRGPGFGPIAQSMDAGPYRGQQIRLSAALRAEVEGSGNQAQLWLRVDRSGGQTGFFDNMGDRPVTSETWDTYQITGPVAADAERIIFGAFLQGEGRAWVDDFTLEVRSEGGDSWSTAPVENAGFEAADEGAMPAGWNVPQEGYKFDLVEQNPAGGQRSLRIASRAPGTQMAQPLFEERPASGEVVRKPLGRGLSAQVPLALHSREGQTLRPKSAPDPGALTASLDEIDLNALSAGDAALRYGNVIMAWNVFQHFYPYFDVVEVNWDAVLTRTLQRARDDRSNAEFLQTLRRMVAQLDDGHGRVLHPLTQTQAGLPIRVDYIENEVVVTAVADTALSSRERCIERGDVVAFIDGTPAGQVLTESKRFISGSPQWTTHRALQAFGRGERDADVQLTLRRGDEETVCTLTRDFDGGMPSGSGIPDERPEPITELEEGIYYIDLTRAEMEAIGERMDALAEAQGVIFDMRGYPEGGNQAVLQHLSSDTLRSARWQKPQIIYPDQEELAPYDTSGRWTLPPRAPQISGEVVFLTDARAISYAESIMGIAEHYRLGDIVGRPTAGANGNVNPFTLPGDYRVTWTGMRVIKHDRSQHHLVGIRPTVPVEQTIEGVRSGRDEDLERALELIR